MKNSDRLPKGVFEPNTSVLATTSDFSVIYKINSKGLRDKEYSYIKPKGKIRILAFGDSYTFGEGIEYGKRFTDIPENYFPNLEIINFGVPGWGIDQELVRFAAEGLKYSPDYVIIFINLADVNRYSTNILRNDAIVLEDTVSQKPVNDSSTLFLSKDDALFHRDSGPILKKSQFLNYLNYQITLVKLKRNLEQQDKEIWDKIRGLAKLRKGAVENNKDEIDNIQKRTKMIISKFNEICKENNIKLIIVKIDKTGDLDYIAHLDDNILYYDLTDGIRQESQRYLLTFKYDGHYNRKTHNYIGRKVIELLQDIMIK
ncbi:MAG: SGNH/GDSL hydrolase family protein [Candidatus Omnitrophica bacterium]|nr:SGNH/GDSL hydrolase family protein [Candidatus Omnitrophota bacterium]